MYIVWGRIVYKIHIKIYVMLGLAIDNFFFKEELKCQYFLFY